MNVGHADAAERRNAPRTWQKCSSKIRPPHAYICSTIARRSEGTRTRRRATRVEVERVGYERECIRLGAGDERADDVHGRVAG